MRLRNLKIRRRKKMPLVDIDITSLLDILVILLVFLLKSYNASDLQLDLKPELSLPGSASQDLGSHQLMVQVNRQGQIWFNGEPMGQLEPGQAHAENLYAALKASQVNEPGRTPASKIVNLVMDQELSYQQMRQIMQTAGMAGLGEFKLIVQANY